MDPLSILGVTAAVVQFVDFGSRLLSRTWDTYKGLGDLDEGKEISQVVKDLGTFSSSVQESAKRFTSQSASSPVNDILLRLCSECDAINTEFQDVLDEISRRRGIKSGTAMKDKVNRLWLAVKWNDSKISSMAGRLEKVKREMLDAVIVDLWRDSKKTEQWELRFSNHLQDVTSMLESMDKSIKTIAKNSEDAAGESSASSPASTVRVEATLARLDSSTRSLLVQAGQLNSLTGVANDIIWELNRGYGANKSLWNIHVDLIRVLWHRDWKLDNSMATSSVHDPATTGLAGIAKLIADSLSFEALRNREDGIATPSFNTMYEWVFRQPPMQQDGRPMWSSIPDWLQGPSTSPFWITGKPGSGKSTITKFIVGHSSLSSHLSSWAGSMEVLVTTYYAWNAGHNMQKSWEGLMRTILVQVLRKQPSLIPLLFSRRWAYFQILKSPTSSPEWTMWEIEESFSAFLGECGKTFKLILFVDGLDEFDTAPAEVVSHIRDLTKLSPDNIKICIASRPWTEFEDAFNESPMLQMHLLTEADMSTFVSNTFLESKGYNELAHLYPQHMAQLQRDIVFKSEGVFLWVAIVVKELVFSLAEGRTVSELRAVLDSLPPGISDLYDSIWARIPPNMLSDASFTLQVFQACIWALPWFTFWLADESGTMKINPNELTPESRNYARQTMKRRLAVRTRGILEIGRGTHGVVQFAHRTASDWAGQPNVWARIVSGYKGERDPHLALIEAKTLLMSDRKTTNTYSHLEFWNSVGRVAHYGSLVEDVPHKAQDLVRILDEFDAATISAYNKIGRHWIVRQEPADFPHKHWSSTRRKEFLPSEREDTFLALMCQFAVLPYIKAKLESKESPVSQKTTIRTFGLGEAVVLGARYGMGSEHFMGVSGDYRLHYSRRLETIRYLVSKGVDFSRYTKFCDVPELPSGEGASGYVGGVIVDDLRNKVLELANQIVGGRPGWTQRDCDFYGQVAEIIWPRTRASTKSKSIMKGLKFWKGK